MIIRITNELEGASHHWVHVAAVTHHDNLLCIIQV